MACDRFSPAAVQGRWTAPERSLWLGPRGDLRLDVTRSAGFMGSDGSTYTGRWRLDGSGVVVTVERRDDQVDVSWDHDRSSTSVRCEWRGRLVDGALVLDGTRYTR